MDNDLSLSQSFGGLRIANPDASSPSPTPSPQIDASPSLAPFRTADVTDAPPPVSRDARASTDPQPQSQSRRHSIFNILRRGEASPDSTPARTPPQYLEAKSAPPNPRHDSNSSESYKAHTDPLARAAASKAYRQSMPLNHQAQQQAQFPPYQSNAMQNGNRGQYVSSVLGRDPVTVGPGLVFVFQNDTEEQGFGLAPARFRTVL